MKQIVLDTETTGLDIRAGHKIIEIGCVELIGRKLSGNTWQRYLNPEREVDQGAIAVHGITDEQLADKPLFADVAESLLEFVRGAELIMHNAGFDLDFLRAEFEHAGFDRDAIEQHCTVTDALEIAKKKHPGQRNNLDALCKRYSVDNSRRTYHGALLDAEILADVYLHLTGGQVALVGESRELPQAEADEYKAADANLITPFVAADEDALREHEKWLELLQKESSQGVVWRK